MKASAESPYGSQRSQFDLSADTVSSPVLFEFGSCICCSLHPKWSIPEYAFILKAKEVTYDHYFSFFFFSFRVADECNEHMF